MADELAFLRLIPRRNKAVQVTVVGKVFRPNPRKFLALNRTLGEYFRLVKWYLCFNSNSKMFLH